MRLFLHLVRSASGLPANCWSILSSNRVFLISKLPHSVLRPPAARSSDSWLNSVVFPEPVGPVKTVSSPRLSPLIIFVKRGKDWSAVPLYSRGCCPIAPLNERCPFTISKLAQQAGLLSSQRNTSVGHKNGITYATSTPGYRLYCSEI